MNYKSLDHNKKNILLVVGAIVLILSITYAVKKRRFADPVGVIRNEEPAEMKDKLRLYLEANESDSLCAYDFFGYDDLYVYIERLCGKFQLEDDKVTMMQGLRIPTRVTYQREGKNFTFNDLAQPRDGGSFGDSLRGIFPKVIYDKWRKDSGQAIDLSVFAARLK